jgi:hypothetical protein
VRELGVDQEILAQKFGITQPAASVAVRRGEMMIKQRKFSIDPEY